VEDLPGGEGDGEGAGLAGIDDAVAVEVVAVVHPPEGAGGAPDVEGPAVIGAELGEGLLDAALGEEACADLVEVVARDGALDAAEGGEDGAEVL